MVLMALGMLAWPLLQWLKYGDAYVQEAFIEQVAQRFAPSLSGREDSWSAYSIFINGEPVPRMIGLAAALWLPFALRRPELAMFPALVLGFWVVVALASGYISPRYSLLVLPLLTISTAAIIIDTAARPALAGRVRRNHLRHRAWTLQDRRNAWHHHFAICGAGAWCWRRRGARLRRAKRWWCAAPNAGPGACPPARFHTTPAADARSRPSRLLPISRNCRPAD